MSRQGHQLVSYSKGSGNAVNLLPGATVSIYLANTSTPIKVWDSATGGTSTSSTPQTTADSVGQAQFWVDTDDGYNHQDMIDIIVESGAYSRTISSIPSMGQLEVVYLTNVSAEVTTDADQGAIFIESGVAKYRPPSSGATQTIGIVQKTTESELAMQLFGIPGASFGFWSSAASGIPVTLASGNTTLHGSSATCFIYAYIGGASTATNQTYTYQTTQAASNELVSGVTLTAAQDTELVGFWHFGNSGTLSASTGTASVASPVSWGFTLIPNSYSTAAVTLGALSGITLPGPMPLQYQSAASAETIHTTSATELIMIYGGNTTATDDTAHLNVGGKEFCGTIGANGDAELLFVGLLAANVDIKGRFGGSTTASGIRVWGHQYTIA